MQLASFRTFSIFLNLITWNMCIKKKLNATRELPYFFYFSYDGQWKKKRFKKNFVKIGPILSELWQKEERVDVFNWKMQTAIFVHLCTSQLKIESVFLGLGNNTLVSLTFQAFQPVTITHLYTTCTDQCLTSSLVCIARVQVGL